MTQFQNETTTPHYSTRPNCLGPDKQIDRNRRNKTVIPSRIFICYTILPFFSALWSKKNFQLDNGRKTFRLPVSHVVHKKVSSDFNKLTDKTGRHRRAFLYKLFISWMWEISLREMGRNSGYREIKAICKGEIVDVYTFYKPSKNFTTSLEKKSDTNRYLFSPIILFFSMWNFQQIEQMAKLSRH